jgi:uncharacterized protein (TIGR02271 family)
VAQRIPLLAEQLEVDKLVVETGRVRVRKRVREHDQPVKVQLQRNEVEVRRVVVNRAVEQPAATRQEGDVTIVPVHEEVLVVTTQLMLKEELHISRRSTTRPSEVAPVRLRHEEVEVTHVGSDGGPREPTKD